MVRFWFQKHIVFRMNCFYNKEVLWKCYLAVTEELKDFGC